MVGRKHFIDWTRGFAVVAMVVWHTADGWLLPAARIGNGWAALRFVGGLAAPSFLFLAGVGAALASKPERAPPPLLVASARGLEIVLLGYALRLQTWLVDAAALIKPHLARAWLPLVVGYLLLFFALRAVIARRRQGGALALAGAAACAIGFAQVPFLAPGRLARLLQVDVLQAIGASLVVLALADRGCKLLARPTLALALGAVVAIAPELVALGLPGPLPTPLAAYLGKIPAAPGAPLPALFPLLPWLSYACFGAALGTLLRDRQRESEWLIVAAALAGAILALLSSEAYPAVQRTITAMPWTVHPLRVVFRVGLVLVLLLVGWLWSDGGRGRVLLAYGRASLRIYWTHLLVAYGVLGAPFRKQLGVVQWALGVVALLALMWLLAKLRFGARVPRELQTST